MSPRIRPSLDFSLFFVLAFSVNSRFCVKIPVDQPFLFKVTSQISLPVLMPGWNFCRLSWTCLQRHSLLYESDWSHSTIASEGKRSCPAFSCSHSPLARVSSGYVLRLRERWTDRWMSGWFINSFGRFSQGKGRKEEEPPWHTAHHCYQQLGDENAFQGNSIPQNRFVGLNV